MCECTEPLAFVDGEPKIGGLHDPRLGTTDKRFKCKTCGGNSTECQGHFGHIALAKPLYHIGFIKATLAVMRCVCFYCSSFLRLPVRSSFCPPPLPSSVL